MRTNADLLDGAAINDIFFAELCACYDTVEGVEDLTELLALSLLPIPKPALFIASRAFRQYRAAGGRKESVLADFFIGAQAPVLGMPLLTRDPRPYRTYFPQLELIAP